MKKLFILILLIPAWFAFEYFADFAGVVANLPDSWDIPLGLFVTFSVVGAIVIAFYKLIRFLFVRKIKDRV